MIKSYLFIFLMIILQFISSCNQQESNNMEKILVVTGGHDFEPSFFQIFDSYQDVKYDTVAQPGFNRMLVNGISEKYDALVFYDMWQEISDVEKKAFTELLKNGQGMVFLHHSLVSYQHWGEFEKIIGGKYVEKDSYDDPNIKGSTYKHDITLNINVADKSHPVTTGITDFSIFDEGYKFIQMVPGIHPLLTTAHPDCTPNVAWTNSYENSKIVYLLLGHDHHAHENENYRQLIRNAISWVGGKDIKKM